MNTSIPIALITGGSRGLGRDMALKLAAQGTDVILTYRSRREEADAVVAEIEAAGRRAVALQLDVGDSASFDTFIAQVADALRTHWQRERFDYLVNNAGVGVHAAFADIDEAQFDLLMNVHLKGPFFLTQKLLPLIADGGRILNISSGLARFALPGYSAYAAMKGAIEVLTRYQAKELGARGIAVNVLAPGAIETDFGGGAVRDNAQLNGFVAANTALGRAGLPEDIGPPRPRCWAPAGAGSTASASRPQAACSCKPKPGRSRTGPVPARRSDADRSENAVGRRPSGSGVTAWIRVAMFMSQMKAERLSDGECVPLRGQFGHARANCFDIAGVDVEHGASACIAGDAIKIQHRRSVAGVAGPRIALDDLDQALHTVAFGVPAHAHVRALALAHAREKAALFERALDGVVHHVVGNDPLLRAVDAFDRAVAARDFHAVVFAGAFGEDELHAGATGRSGSQNTRGCR